MTKIITLDDNQFEEHDGRLVAIVWRRTGRTVTDICPFCGRQHNHGTAEGMRAACHTKSVSVRRRSDGRETIHEDGYVVKYYT